MIRRPCAVTFADSMVLGMREDSIQDTVVLGHGHAGRASEVGKRRVME
jgi:hypothetical protein